MKTEFDFGDIAGKKTVTATEKDIPEVATGKTEALTGITITMPVENVKGTYRSKDLAECTGEEFIIWSQGVHLPRAMPPADRLQTVKSRVAVFNQITFYHQTQLLSPRKGNKKETALC